MTNPTVQKAIFLSDAERLHLLRPDFQRLYFGNEFCSWRLPSAEELKRVREAAREQGVGFTFVTPYLNQIGLKQVLKILEWFSPAEGTEVVVNDVGFLEMLSREKWEGVIVIGRLLTRQQRGAGWKNSTFPKDGAARYLRSCNLDSPSLVEWFHTRYGVRRFEIDNLIQGVEIKPLSSDIRLSVYYPFIYLTTSRRCPWSFNGREWRNLEDCSSPCRNRILILNPEEGGRPILMGGGTQFLKNDAPNGVYRGPGVDRWIYQPVIPT